MKSNSKHQSEERQVYTAGRKLLQVVAICTVCALLAVFNYAVFYPSEGQKDLGRFSQPAVAAGLKDKVIETLPSNPAITTTTTTTAETTPVTTANVKTKKLVTSLQSNPAITTTTTTTTVATTTTTTTTATTAAATTQLVTSDLSKKDKLVTSLQTNPAVATTATSVVVETTIVTKVVTRVETQVVTQAVTTSPSKKDKVISTLAPNPTKKDKAVGTLAPNPTKKDKAIGTIAPNPAGSDQGSPEANYPWVVEIKKSNGWFSVTNTIADAKKLCEFNGYEYPNCGAEGYYFVPSGMSLKVDSYLVFDGTLYSIIKDANVQKELLEENNMTENAYHSPIRVPAGYALSIGESSVSKSYKASFISTIEEITISEVISEVKEVTSIVEITAAALPETVTETQVSTTTTVVETTTEAPITTTESTTPATTTVVTTTTLEKKPTPVVTASSVIPISENKFVGDYPIDKSAFDEIVKGFSSEDVGFAIGSTGKMLYSWNGQKLLPTDCIGKPAPEAHFLWLLAHEKDINTGEMHSPYEMVTITEEMFICRDNSTILSEANGHYVGEMISLADAMYYSISASDNVGYEVVAQLMQKWYGVNDRKWLTETFGRVYYGAGRYGYQTPERMLKEAEFVADFINSNEEYGWMLKSWMDMQYAGLPCHIAYECDRLDDWNYIGYKIGWYDSQQTEMVILEDENGNVLCVVAMTMRNGETILPKIGDAICKKTTWAVVDAETQVV